MNGQVRLMIICLWGVALAIQVEGLSPRMGSSWSAFAGEGSLFKSPVRSPMLHGQQALAVRGSWMRRTAVYPFHSAAGRLATARPSLISKLPGEAWRLTRYEIQKGLFFLTMLYRLLIHRVVPVASGDINETFLAFTHPEGEKTFYKGSGLAIRETLQGGSLYLLTGDSIKEVEDKFLHDLEAQEGIRLSSAELAFLHVLPLAGQDRYHFEMERGRWIGKSLFPGITDAELVILRGILDEVNAEFEVLEKFIEYGNPGLMEVRQALSGFYMAFKPAGKVPAEKRKEFRQKYEPLLFEMVRTINERLPRRGLGHLHATKAGSTTIDIRTADKGKALVKIQNEELKPWEYIVYLGDNLAKGGGDEQAMEAASIGVHVGPVTPQAIRLKRELHSTGRKLVLSPYTASEGSTAEYLRLINWIRRIASHLQWIPGARTPAPSGSNPLSKPDGPDSTASTLRRQIRFRQAA